ncbi:MAG: lysophospholipid acyltransferase family protein [Steroidobacteraceae bacterium]
MGQPVYRNMSDNQGPQDRLRNTLYRTAMSPGPRMTPRRRALYAVGAPLGIGLIKLWWRMCRVVHVEGAEHLDAALAEGSSLIPCYWHQHQLFCAKWLLEQRSRGLTVGWLVSPSLDGELGAMLVHRLQGVAIRGSSTHTGAKALRDYYQALVKDRISPIITPDGPRGPRFRFKPGAILLSQLSGRPILPMAYAASSAWVFHWDKFVLPKPLSRIAVAIGPPCHIPRAADPAELERRQLEMQRELHRLYGEAKRALD